MKHDRWPLHLGMAVAGSAAVVASATTLAALARAAGWEAMTPWLLPASLDVGSAVGVWCWLRPGVPESARLFARRLAVVGSLATLTGNATGHLIESKLMEKSAALVIVVGAVPAAVLVALAHLAALLSVGSTQSTLAPDSEESVTDRAADSPPPLTPDPVAAGSRDLAAGSASSPGPVAVFLPPHEPVTGPAETGATTPPVEVPPIAGRPRLVAPLRKVPPGKRRVAPVGWRPEWKDDHAAEVSWLASQLARRCTAADCGRVAGWSKSTTLRRTKALTPETNDGTKEAAGE